jgi:hypothetical protein
MYPVCEECRLGRESVCLLGRAGRKPNSFFLFCGWSGDFLWGFARRYSDGILPLTDLSARQRGFHRV